MASEGVDVVEIASGELVVHVLPALGGRIASVRDVVGDREWLWRNPHVETGPSPLGADYDSRWQGGFEELFPNDAATMLDGVELPDHGELWAAPWTVVDRGPAHVELRVVGPVTGVEITKRCRVEGSQLHVSYRLRNGSGRDWPYLFKLHPALAVDGDCRLELPGGTVEAVDAGFSGILPPGGPWPWPGPPSSDISICLDADARTQEFVYVHDLPDGWVGVRDERSGRRLRLRYPTAVFDWCWLFLTYGGWQELQVAVLEPCTTHPKDLHTAIAAGTTPTLAAGEERVFDVTLTVSAI